MRLVTAGRAHVGLITIMSQGEFVYIASLRHKTIQRALQGHGVGHRCMEIHISSYIKIASNSQLKRTDKQTNKQKVRVYGSNLLKSHINQ